MPLLLGLIASLGQEIRRWRAPRGFVEIWAVTDLLNYLRDLAEHLARDKPLAWREGEASLSTVEGSLEGFKARYRQAAPAGAEAVQALVLEAVELFTHSLDGIYDFIETKDPASLRQAVAQAEEVDDILSAVEYAVEQNKQWIYSQC